MSTALGNLLLLENCWVNPLTRPSADGHPLLKGDKAMVLLFLCW
jgi:hypothetical protein